MYDSNAFQKAFPAASALFDSGDSTARKGHLLNASLYAHAFFTRPSGN
jgi:hypothetical protein